MELQHLQDQLPPVRCSWSAPTKIHSLKSFHFVCPDCGELFASKRSINSHRQRCDGKANRPNLCGHCGARYVREESLCIHLLYCTENDQCSVTEMTVEEDDDLAKFVCKYCSSSWPSQRSLSGHIWNSHMAESQRDRTELLKSLPVGSTRQLWTEELRKRFLDVADQVGWKDHTAIARVLNLSVCQIQNFRSKFSKDRWKCNGNAQRMDSPFNEAGYSQDELRCNGNAQRTDLPLNEAGYSKSAMGMLREWVLHLMRPDIPRMEFYSLLPKPVRRIASLVMSW